MVCCSLWQAQAVAQWIANGLTLLQMLADRQDSFNFGRLNEHQREELAEMTVKSWAAGQGGDRLEQELLCKLLRSGALLPHLTSRELLLGKPPSACPLEVIQVVSSQARKQGPGRDHSSVLGLWAGWHENCCGSSYTNCSRASCIECKPFGGICQCLKVKRF